MKRKPEEYRHIAAWGRLLGSFVYYVEGQQRQAAEEGAPLDAIYRDHATREWRTMRDVTNDRTRAEVEALVE